MTTAMVLAPAQENVNVLPLNASPGCKKEAPSLEAQFVDLVFSSEVDWLAPVQALRPASPDIAALKAA